MHRNPQHGPASLSKGGVANGGNEVYFTHGKYHRHPTEGPAFQWNGGVPKGGDEAYYFKENYI